MNITKKQEHEAYNQFAEKLKQEKEIQKMAGIGTLMKDLGIYEEMTSELTIREKQILEVRFGITDGFLHTLDSVGEEFGITRDRIRQIQRKAIEKIKHHILKMKEAYKTKKNI